MELFSGDGAMGEGETVVDIGQQEHSTGFFHHAAHGRCRVIWYEDTYLELFHWRSLMRELKYVGPNRHARHRHQPRRPTPCHVLYPLGW